MSAHSCETERAARSDRAAWQTPIPSSRSLETLYKTVLPGPSNRGIGV